MSLNFKTPMLHQDYNFSSSQLMFEGWTGWTWVLGLGQSLLNYVGVVLILLALRHVSPTQNKVIRSFQVVASYTLQVELLTWHRRPPCAAPGDPVRHAAARLGLRGCGAHHGRRHGQRHRDRGHGAVQGQAAVHLTFSSHAVYLGNPSKKNVENSTFHIPTPPHTPVKKCGKFSIKKKKNLA